MASQCSRRGFLKTALAGGIREWPWQTDTSVSWKSWGHIDDVKLLGSDARLDWHQAPAALTVQMPLQKPGDIAYVLKVTV